MAEEVSVMTNILRCNGTQASCIVTKASLTYHGTNGTRVEYHVEWYVHVSRTYTYACAYRGTTGTYYTIGMCTLPAKGELLQTRRYYHWYCTNYRAPAAAAVVAAANE